MNHALYFAFTIHLIISRPLLVIHLDDNKKVWFGQFNPHWINFVDLDSFLPSFTPDHPILSPTRPNRVEWNQSSWASDSSEKTASRCILDVPRPSYKTGPTHANRIQDLFHPHTPSMYSLSIYNASLHVLPLHPFATPFSLVSHLHLGILPIKENKENKKKKEKEKIKKITKIKRFPRCRE